MAAALVGSIPEEMVVAWESMTIYVCAFLRNGSAQHTQGYHQVANLQKARAEWTAKNTKPPATGKDHDEYETETKVVYVTDVERP